MFYPLFDDLAAWFVDSKYFGENITKWASYDSTAWLTGTTAATRKRVEEDLTGDKESANKISKVILQLVASCGEQLQKYTFDDWQRIISYNGPFPPWNDDRWHVKSKEEKEIDAHSHFVSEFKRCLDRITVCGVGTRAACDYIITCIRRKSDGAFGLSEDTWQKFMLRNKQEQEQKARLAELQEKERQAEKQRDATRDTAPPSEPNEQTKQTSTPRPPASWFSRFGKWGKGEEQPSGERIRQLLSRMQELNA